METLITGQVSQRAPLWTSAEHPVVCWPLHRTDHAQLDYAFHSHPDMEATVVLEGVQELRYADAALAYGPGEVWFAAPGEIHGYRTKGGVACICLAFGPYFLADSMLGDRHWLAIFAQPPVFSALRRAVYC